MMLIDKMNGPLWLIWIIAAVFAVISAVLLSGHGAGLIAGYNTASAEEKAKTDEKKLCRVMGIGSSVITVMIIIMAAGAKIIPAAYSRIFPAVSVTTAAVCIILANTVCKK